MTRKKLPSKNSLQGISLAESLLSLSLFLVLLLGGLEIFASGRRVFFKLKSHQETMVSVSAALSKIKTDLREAGYGLLPAMRDGLLMGVELDSGTLILKRAEKFLAPSARLLPGQTILETVPKTKIKKGRDILISSSNGTEIATVAAGVPGRLTLASPLKNTHPKKETTLALIRKTALFLDLGTNTVRREINDGAAQPLFEGAAVFEAIWDDTQNLVTIRLSSQQKKEKIHVLSLCPVNAAMSLRK